MSRASLRRTALVWMTGLLAGIGLAAMLVAYVLARNEASDFLDGQLRQVALNAGPTLSDGNAPPAADQDPEDQIAVTIWRNGQVVRDDPGVEMRKPERLGYADAMMGGERWRTYATGDGVVTVRVAQRDLVRVEFARSAALGAAAPLLLLIPLSWIVVGWAMNRVLGRLDSLVQDLAGRGVAAAAPLPMAGVPVEIAPLVTAMNGLILRLQTALGAQRRFVADAAHELRTPLAAMQAQLDASATARNGDAEAGRSALAAGLHRASRLVDQLLRLARLDDTAPQGSRTLDVGPMLLDLVADHAVLARRSGVDLGACIETAASVSAAEDEIQTLLASLLDNALRYTPAGGHVDVGLHREGGSCTVTIRDTGCGLPPGTEAHLFDRFFRAAPPEVDGTGLGLAIARRIADRNGLGLTVENRPDGQRGVLARVVLPSR